MSDSIRRDIVLSVARELFIQNVMADYWGKNSTQEIIDLSIKNAEMWADAQIEYCEQQGEKQ